MFDGIRADADGTLSLIDDDHSFPVDESRRKVGIV